MAINKLALIRYRTIDICLQNRTRKWTLIDIMEKVSDAIFEYEGIASGVSKRTIQGDIQLMRSDKLGYNAPIIVTDKRYYSYANPSYSITNMPIQSRDIEKLNEILGLLKHFSGFSYFSEMSALIAKLENTLNSSLESKYSYIQFETIPNLKGQHHLQSLYEATLQKKSLLIEYQSFKAKQAQLIIFYPYLLKEFRNRWFLIGKQKNKDHILNLALDRMLNVQTLDTEPYLEHNGVSWERYFSDIIGVTKGSKDRAQKIILEFTAEHLPYVLTKPMHASQQLIKKNLDGSGLIRIDVVLNFELEKEILAFGEFVQVKSPRKLNKIIQRRISKMNSLYQNE